MVVGVPSVRKHGCAVARGSSPELLHAIVLPLHQSLNIHNLYRYFNFIWIICIESQSWFFLDQILNLFWTHLIDKETLRNPAGPKIKTQHVAWGPRTRLPYRKHRFQILGFNLISWNVNSWTLQELLVERLSVSLCRRSCTCKCTYVCILVGLCICIYMCIDVYFSTQNIYMVQYM